MGTRKYKLKTTFDDFYVEESHKFKFNSEDLKNHIERLEKLGFIKVFDKNQFFKLTDSANYFKVGLEKEFTIIDEIHFNKRIELFHIFLCFKEKEV